LHTRARVYVSGFVFVNYIYVLTVSNQQHACLVLTNADIHMELPINLPPPLNHYTLKEKIRVCTDMGS